MPELFDDTVRKIAISQVKFAILKLFKENPYVMDSRGGLALWVGKPEDVLARELEEMVDMGVIHQWGSEPGAIYAYTRNQETRRRIQERWLEISRLAEEARLQQDKAMSDEDRARGGREAGGHVCTEETDGH